MERYIGMDVHAASCTLAVIGPSGKRLKEMVVETNGQCLIEALKLIPGSKRLCMEEGTQSQWLYEILSPHVAELAVLHLCEKRRGQKNDSKDAFHLAERMRTGTLETRVHKGLGAFKRLRQLIRTHDMIVGDVVRVQGRIKAIYRSWGVQTPGKTVYNSARSIRRIRTLL